MYFILLPEYIGIILYRNYIDWTIVITIVRTTGQLGPRLKQLRKAKGWSQSELGNRIGLSQERVSAVENHPEKVTFDQILTFLMALDGEIQIWPGDMVTVKSDW